MTFSGSLPLIAIVGRPNVGKSTLFNRITGRRRALVSREPGMTRDRHFGIGDWSGRYFRVVDTGGLQQDDSVLSRLISDQARKAIQDAALVLFVVDGREGITSRDLEIAKLLRRANRPVILIVNKLDTPNRFDIDAEFHELGFEKTFSVSAEHGTNVDEVLDYVIEKLEIPQSDEIERKNKIPIVILGKPNAGKSTFLNALLGEERLVASEIPGTTRDTIDIEVQHNEQTYQFIDTAGIRKKGATKTVPDKLAVIHARKSLERAKIACIMIDGREGVTHQDAVVAGYARDAGKAIVVILNKMDLLDSAGRKALEMEVKSKLKFISFAPCLYVSAKTGQNVGKIFKILDQVYQAYSKRVTTGQLNALFDKALSDRYLGTFKGKPVKLKYITQTGIQPPTFVLFTNAASTLHFSHLRYLENQLRKYFEFEGTTIRIKVRSGSKRKTHRA
jgi:GTP-binding protein